MIRPAPLQTGMTTGEWTVSGLLSEIASERVSPAGGTAAAVVGALGASLCEMGCVHTIGNDACEGAAQLRDVRDELRTQRGHLLELGARDSAVVDELFGASGDVGQTEAKRAIGVPFTIARACLTVIECGEVVVESGARSVVTDVRAGVLFAHSALRASVFTVRSNLGQVDDRSFVERIDSRTATIEETAERAFERVTSDAERRR